MKNATNYIKECGNMCSDGDDIETLREEKRAQIEKWKNRKRDEKEENRRKKKEETKKRQSDKSKEYYKENKERILEYNKRYKDSHKDEIKMYKTKYSETHKEQNREYSRKYISENKEKMKAYRSEWIKTRRGKVKNLINSHHELRGLGFNPINQYFEGSHYHHMYLNGSTKLGMFIPKKLHRSIIHDGRTTQGMRKINNAALLWLCEQSIIIKEEI